MHVSHKERAHLLQTCRAVMPGVAGVVLSTLDGGVVAHEEARVRDPHALAREAVEARAAQTSALVRREDELYLVVFVPPPLAQRWQAAAAPA